MYFYNILFPVLQVQATDFVFAGFSIVILLGVSALVSGSESAIFSISSTDTLSIPEGKKKDTLLRVLGMPKRILATILLTNNTVNVAFVLITARFIEKFNMFGSLQTIVQISLETLLLLVFGEVIPKIYATAHKTSFGIFVSPILLGLKAIFNPIVNGMVNMTNFIDNRVKKKNHNVSIDELSHAIDITSDENDPYEEKKILKGIIKFGNLVASQIMTSRSEIEAIDYNASAKEVLHFIQEKGFSRVPIYGENMDDIKGILYVKDLLKYASDLHEFNWHKLIRPPLFIPERKPIDDLLEEFQEKRVHMGIVVDEYGGTEGMVTMEDILEQVFGEIMDEFDEVNINYSELSANKYLFDAQTMLTDVMSIAQLEDNIFDEFEDEADTLAGLLMEISGSIPKKGDEIKLQNLTFTVESASSRKIHRIKLVINEKGNLED